MKTPTTDNRSARTATAAPEAQRAARMQDAAHAEELESSRRLQQAQARQEHEKLVRESADREGRNGGDTTLIGPSY